MGPFLETHNLDRLNNEEVENMNRPNRRTDFDLVFKSNPKTAQDQRGQFYHKT